MVVSFLNENNMSKWIKWDGGEMPVPKGLPIKVKYRSGAVAKCKAGDNNSSCWEYQAVDSDIVAYKIANGWVKHDCFYPEGLDQKSVIHILRSDGAIDSYYACSIVWNSPVWAGWYKVNSPAQTVTPNTRNCNN